MPLQNRVTPFGEIVSVPDRGLYMGNRGVLHDHQKRLGRRRWVLKAWLICLLDFKGRQRKVMTPKRYTELFFLDEAAAIAAGHRPCYECRRTDFLKWQAAWQEGLSLPEKLRAPEIDVCLHEERLVPRTRQKLTWRAPLETLPDGTFIDIEGQAYLVQAHALRRWSWQGYGEARARLRTEVSVLTPPSSVAALRGGYMPDLHPSALS